MNMKRRMKIKKTKIKVRKTWTRNPETRIEPNKRVQDEPFDGSLYRGQKITEEDLENMDDDFGRGFHD